MHTETHTGLDSPTGIWWKPAHKTEKVWVGIAFAWWARIHLGRLWSARITKKAGHRIVGEVLVAQGHPGARRPSLLLRSRPARPLATISNWWPRGAQPRPSNHAWNRGGNRSGAVAPASAIPAL